MTITLSEDSKATIPRLDHSKKDVRIRAKEDRELEKKLEKTLPKIEPLRGTLCRQMKRCGRSNCKCAKGELHGPYYYLFWIEIGRLRKAYIRKADVDRVRNLCQAKRRNQQALEASFDLWRNLQSELREVESYVRDNQA
jgi:hypothetical protein